MVKISWTDLAKEDLRAIHDYISKDSRTYANRFIDRLISRAGQLATNPKSGRVVSEFNKDEIRELIEGSYRIVYKYVGSSATILRVHHSARQLTNL